MPRIKYHHLVFLAILILGAVLRFYRLPEMANYDFDQQYASNFAYAVIKEYPLQLIGQELSVQGLFMGPFYFYYLVPFFSVYDLHPIGGFVGSVVLGLITIVAYYVIGSKVFGVRAGLVLAFFRSVLFARINDDWTMVPSYSAELLVLLTWYFLYRYFHGDTKVLPLVGFSFGLFTSFHPILFPFYLVFLILFLLARKFPDIKTSLLSIFAFLAPVIPLILFEFLHNFLEIKQLISLFTNPSFQGKDLGDVYNNLLIIISGPYRMFGMNFLSKEVFFVLSYGFLAFLIFKRTDFWKDSFHKLILAVTFVVFLFYYSFFPTHVPEYYFMGIVTLITLYLGASLSLLSKTRSLYFLLLIILAVITFYNLKTLNQRWNYPAHITLYHKDFIVKEILKDKPKDGEFYVSYIKNPGWNFGFDYLFKLYGQVPQTIEAKPPVYTIVIPKALSEDSLDIRSGNIGLILPE